MMRSKLSMAGFVAMVALAMAGASTQSAVAQETTTDQPDKYTWLEDVHGEKPMAWVKAEDARTAAVLEKQKPFEELRDEALKVLDSPDELPGPVFRGGMI